MIELPWEEKKMDAKAFWDKVDEQLRRQGLTITELAVLIGKSRGTLFSQRNLKQLPKVEQWNKMEEVLKCKFLDDDNSFEEYLPYLRQAEEWQLKSVRQILNMPEPVSKKDGNYSAKAN